jgi:hypothetical protein
MRTVIWVHDGPVCVTVIDDSPCPTPALHCQCQACSAANHVEWAARYLAPPG